MAKRNWDKTIFAQYLHVSSPSQLADYLDCPRKWWFRRCVRLPERDGQKKFVFGNCLDEVANRWLSADDNGRGPDGKPVDLYPEGWSEGLERVEAVLVRMLVEKGISDGTLRRVPGRKIQAEYTTKVLEGICTTGAMDMVSPEGVEDNKTTSSLRWAMTQKDLAADPKMLCYAKEWLREHPEAAQVKLRLNYFVKDAEQPATKWVEVLVPAAAVEDFWKKTSLPAHQGMLDLKAAKIPELQWRRVTGPQSQNTCRKYGGCPFARICGGCQTPAAYKAEIDRINLKKQPMSIFGKKSPAPQTPPPAVTPEAKPEPVAPSTPNAPWAVEGCAACKGRGINKAGNPCMACYHIRKRRGESTVDDFDVSHDEAGNLVWKAKSEAVPQAQAPAAVEGKAQVVAPPKTKRAKPPKAIEPEIKEAPAPQLQEAVTSEPRGFRLFLNALPIGQEFVDAGELLGREGAELAEAQGVKSYYELDAFKRRDAIAAQASAIATELAGKALVVVGGGQDLKALIEALRPFAAEVVQGVF